MTNKEIITKLEELYFDQMRIERITDLNKFEIKLLIDKIKSDATTTTNT